MRSASRVRHLLVIPILWVSVGCGTWQAAQLYQSGTAALDAGETDRAIEELERAANLQPGRSEIYNHLGLAHAAAGRPEVARLHLQRAVDLDCTNRVAVRNLALLGAGEIVLQSEDQSGEGSMERGLAP